MSKQSSTMHLTLLYTICFFVAISDCQPSSSNGPTVHFTDNTGRTALLWSSIGLAVVTSLLQGLVTTIVAVAEDQGMWTFRFRIARFEHWWWTIISTLLALSFGLIVLSFLSGNNNDSLGLLALSTATTITIVRYALPAWRNRRYIENRWLAWTGNSRTAIRAIYKDMCGDAAAWKRLADEPATNRILSTASDAWGFALKPPKGLWQDPTALLEKFGENKGSFVYNPAWPMGPCVYDDGLESETSDVSLLWGEREGFRRRVSRAINSLPLGLLASRPFTVDGYNGEGQYVFDLDDALKTRRGITRNRERTRISTELENSSTWSPRPDKVMRSYYARSVDEQYGTLSQDFRNVATELSLIFLDIQEKSLRTWLRLNLDQQSIDVNKWMSCRPSPHLPRPRATPDQLHTLYRASYTSMIISLNYFAPGGTTSSTHANMGMPVRPDLICFALLWLADHTVRLDPKTGWHVEGPGVEAPEWWEQNWVRGRLGTEYAALKEGWREPAAWLLGLKGFPAELDVERWPEWPHIKYLPMHAS